MTTGRDLINEHAIRQQLLEDLERWHRVCTAMDVLSGRGPLPDQLDAVNVLAEEADVAPLASATNQHDIDSALQSIGDGLERRLRRLRKGFAARPLEAEFISFKDLGYAIEKMCGMTRSSGDAAMAKGYVEPLEQLVATVRTGMNARGLYGDEETADLDYILDRVRCYLDGTPGSPQRDDLDFMVRMAFPQLIDRLRSLAREIDEGDQRY